jgi:2-phospho-L-lactate guanylyltransferase
MWCVIPAKLRASAKQRLSPMLGSRERATLCAVMLKDVLATATKAEGLAGVVLVTGDCVLAQIGRQFGARILDTGGDEGTRRAVEFAALRLAREHAAGMLVLPSDIPAITPVEIRKLLSVHRAPRALTITPAAHDLGTNALVVSPCDAVQPCFGERSFPAHLDAARRVGIEPSIVPLPGIGFDIDRPQDLVRFLALNTDTATHRFIEDLNLLGHVGPRQCNECMEFVL